MNKLFLALIFVACSFTVSMGQSTLKVRLTDNAPVTVSVDGRYFNRRGTSITVGDLPYGNHILKIYSQARYGWGRAYQETIFSGRVRTYQGMITFFSYNPYSGRINAYEQEMYNDNRNTMPPGSNYDNNYNRSNDRPNNDANNSYNDNNYIPENKQENTTDGNQPYRAPENRSGEIINDAPSSAPVASPAPSLTSEILSDSKADNLRKKVNAKATDTEKMKELKESLKNEKLSTYQVSFIMDWFSFESSKVEFAKWAYDITVDKENYSDLAQKFTFKNSQEELNDFIKSRQ